MKRRLASIALVCLAFGASLLLTPAPLAAQSVFRTDFSSPELTEWVLTSKNDFHERRVELSDDGKLRVRADTMGTRDETVKFLGARLRRAYEVDEGLCVNVTLDWNDQANGSYLTAALILAGAETDSNPLDLSDWLAVEYVGVPPGKNARMQIRAQTRAQATLLADEGWPDEQTTGRKIDEVRIELHVSPERVSMWENATLLHDEMIRLSLRRVFVHLQMASHSNYRAREVYFDDVEVRRGACASAGGR